MIGFVIGLEDKDQGLYQEMIARNQRSRYMVKMTGKDSEHCSSALNKPEKSQRERLCNSRQK